MNNYVVRGPNWRIDVELGDNVIGDDSYLFYEAATQAVELIFRNMDNNEFDPKNKPKIGQFIQVALDGYDIYNSDDEELVETYIESGLLRFISSTIILANAGKYTQAEFLKKIIENED